MSVGRDRVTGLLVLPWGKFKDTTTLPLAFPAAYPAPVSSVVMVRISVRSAFRSSVLRVRA